MIMTSARLASNPTHILAMRALGCHERTWRHFFACQHWLLAPAGLILAMACYLGPFPRPALLALPVAVLYYGFVMQTGANVAREIQKRGQLPGLLMIPGFDPLEMGAAMALARKYESGRAGSAAMFFAALPLLGAAYGGAGSHYFIGGLLLLTIGYSKASGAAVLRPKRRQVITYREIVEVLRGLEVDYRTYFSRSLRLWLCTIGLIVACVFTMLRFDSLESEIVASVVCLGLFFWLRRAQAEPAPDAATARRRILGTLRKAV